MLPTHFVRLEKVPVTPNGKVDRKALPPPAVETAQPAHDHRAPGTDTEKALAVMWAELLNVDRIGLDDEFFELGGHSLLAMRAVSRIRDAFEVDIPLEVMFANPTIAGLANARGPDSRPSVDASNAAAPIQRQARRPRREAR
jgi:acyl carrier protein